TSSKQTDLDQVACGCGEALKRETAFESVFRQILKRATRSIFGFTFSVFATLSFAAGAAADCHLALARARTMARTLSVSTQSKSTTIVGEPVRIEWRNGSIEHPKIPVYFVLTTPPDVRFSGTGFIALTAGAKGLHGVRYGGEGARALAPLHRAIEAAK